MGAGCDLGLNDILVSPAEARKLAGWGMTRSELSGSLLADSVMSLSPSAKRSNQCGEQAKKNSPEMMS